MVWDCVVVMDQVQHCEILMYVCLYVSALAQSARSFSETLVETQTRAKEKAGHAFQINATSVQYLLDL